MTVLQDEAAGYGKGGDLQLLVGVSVSDQGRVVVWVKGRRTEGTNVSGLSPYHHFQ